MLFALACLKQALGSLVWQYPSLACVPLLLLAVLLAGGITAVIHVKDSDVSVAKVRCRCDARAGRDETRACAALVRAHLGLRCSNSARYPGSDWTFSGEATRKPGRLLKSAAVITCMGGDGALCLRYRLFEPGNKSQPTFPSSARVRNDAWHVHV
mgnify:CR=1 FL=1